MHEVLGFSTNAGVIPMKRLPDLGFGLTQEDILAHEMPHRLNYETFEHLWKGDNVSEFPAPRNYSLQSRSALGFISGLACLSAAIIAAARSPQRL